MIPNPLFLGNKEPSEIHFTFGTYDLLNLTWFKLGFQSLLQGFLSWQINSSVLSINIKACCHNCNHDSHRALWRQHCLDQAIVFWVTEKNHATWSLDPVNLFIYLNIHY